MFIKPKTLAAQLGVQIALSLVLVWLLATVVALWVLVKELNSTYDQSLKETAQRVLPLAISDYRLNQFGLLDLRPELSLLGTLNLSVGPRILGDQPEYLMYQLRDFRGRILVRSNNAPMTPMLDSLQTGFTHGKNFSIYTASSLDGRYHLQVAETVDHRYGVLFDTALLFLLVFTIALPLSVLLVYIAVKRRLVPVQQFAENMATRGGSNLEPMAQAELPEDFTEVQKATNALLERLRTALLAEREFAANSAHELRTPLAVASVQLQRLSDELGSTDQAERLKIVQSSLARLTRLIDKLLQLARAESVTLYKGEPTNLELIVKMIARELDPRNDRVEIISESPPLLDIDPDALAVILSNLVENGLKYAPNESPVIIRLESNGAFSVENLAPDLAPEDLNGLKQRFVRGNQRSQPGSGLGLAIVGAMVDQLNGDLDLKIAGEGRGKRLIVKVKI
ncbi:MULTISPECIES: ATP-binding protein [unclassified Marinobacterium]|uniref:sensor histidine kinase n=1 Tax=unclassified Marinobacterium TaxID=2644139 RepID=UPI001569664C|nr:Sensor protein QseC [Marinobacterium sp. xm-g-48]NRP82735.1 Sensor protein QseC [Marinobacterium sp. xm-d-509]